MDKKQKEENRNGNVADGASEQLMQEGDANKYYNVTAHRVVILIYMILTIVLLVFVVPLIVASINWLLTKFGWSETEEFFNSKLLPDFLGGFMGIIIGYVLESTYLRRLKLLRQYEAIKTLLVDELDELFKDLDKIVPDEDKSENKETQSNSANTLLYVKFHTPVINNVVNSCEYANVLYNLPRYSFRSKNKGNILLNLQNINFMLLQNDFFEQNEREKIERDKENPKNRCQKINVIDEEGPNKRYKKIKEEIRGVMKCLKNQQL